MNIAGHIKNVPLIESDSMKNVWYAHGKNAVHWWGLKCWLANLEPFSNRSGSFRGGPAEGSSVGWLESDAPTALLFKERYWLGMIDYVVYSYSTPIAWHDKETGWVDPGHSYSKTTAGKHYGPTTTAISQLVSR